MILGFLWDLLRFFLLFAFLTGNSGLPVREGNFLILLLGISGQPALSFLWWRERSSVLQGHRGAPEILAACRFPGVLVEVLALLAFFTGILPGEGEMLLMNNRLFPGGTGVLLLLITSLVDIFFIIFLISLYSRKEK